MTLCVVPHTNKTEIEGDHHRSEEGTDAPNGMLRCTPTKVSNFHGTPAHRLIGCIGDKEPPGRADCLAPVESSLEATSVLTGTRSIRVGSFTVSIDESQLLPTRR